MEIVLDGGIRRVRLSWGNGDVFMPLDDLHLSLVEALLKSEYERFKAWLYSENMKREAIGKPQIKMDYAGFVSHRAERQAYNRERVKRQKKRNNLATG